MNPQVVAGVSAASALVIGGVAGYFLAKKRLEAQFQEQLAAEVQQAKRFYAKLYKKDEFETPESAADELGVAVVDPQKIAHESLLVGNAVRAIGRYQGKDPSPDVKVVVQNVFKTEGEVTTELSEEEYRARTEEVPYILTQDEYMGNEEDYDQVTFTYYAGDNALADDKDELIEDIDMLVGENNLKRFGHLSGDPRVVYVRNHIRSQEFEILLHDGTYTKHVLGMDD
jgi:hypothetical protein